MYKKFCTFGLVLLVSMGLSHSLFGMPQDADPFGGNTQASATSTSVTSTVPTRKSPADATRELLEVLVDWNFDETPFEEVMESWQVEHKLNVILDQSAVDDALSTDDVVSFKIQNVPFRLAIRLLLDRYNATYVVREDVLLVISKDVAKDPEYFTRKVINCDALLSKIRASEYHRANAISNVLSIGDAAEAMNPRERGGGLGGGRRGAGGGVFSLVPGNEIEGMIDQQGKVDKKEQGKTWFLVQRGFNEEIDLVEMIKSTIVPDDWDDTNGDGTVMIVGRCLIIQQTERSIDQIEVLLEELSATIDQK